VHILQPAGEQHFVREQLDELALLALVSDAGALQGVQPSGGGVHADGASADGVRTPRELHPVLAVFGGCKNRRNQTARRELSRIDGRPQSVPPLPREPRRRGALLEEAPDGRQALSEEH
jgi:hypothetical protein